MRKAFLLVATFTILCSASFSQKAGSNPKTKVLLLGSFHFDNPGLDVAKFEDADILSPRRQKEIAEVINCLLQQHPDKVFVEVTPSGQRRLDSLYGLYLQGGWLLPSNEIYQLGFRVAGELHHQKVYGVDYQQAHFPFDSLVKVMGSEGQFGLLQQFQKTIDSLQKAFNKDLKTMSIKQILIKENSEAADSFNVGGYLDMIRAGGKTNHVGSYLASEWWRRNMVIYENILKRLEGSEKIS